MRLNAEELLRRLEERGFSTDASSIQMLTSDLQEQGDRHAPDDPLPNSIGPFEILGELGQGGFGVVMLGAQQKPVKRLAAVKLLKKGMDSRSVLTRFRAEQQALALMDHPAVATVFESGLSEDGRPWFAMPLITGVAITHHADLEKLSLLQRLHLFRRAAEGVQHAHQRGVLHRDLKPANILVGVEGESVQPRVIDFGIAKAVEGSDPLTSLATQGESLVGTPAYMAPEQVAGNAELRSDVWAMGVILGELLCGARPLDRDPVRTPDGLFEPARFMRPSLRFQRWLQQDHSAANQAAACRGLTGDALGHALRGDLDAIVGKCLEEEPQRRYADMSALIDDIDRHLSGHPVVARPASAGYQLKRFVWRNRLASSAAAIVATSLVAATIFSTRSAMHAEAEARTARAVTDFLIETLSSADPWKQEGQRDMLVRDALDVASRRLEAGEFAGQQQPAARIALAIGVTRLQLGMAQEALPSLERAVALTKESVGTHDSAYAEAQHRLALCLQTLGKATEAEAPMRESVALHEQLDGIDATITVMATNDLALLLNELGQLEQSEHMLRTTLGRIRSLPVRDDKSFSATAGNLGMFLQGSGKPDEAKKLLEEVLQSNRERLGRDNLELSMDYNNLGLLQKDMGDFAEAQTSTQESIRILEKGLGTQHHFVALVQINLAEVMMRQGQLDEAVAVIAKAVATYQALYGPSHPEVARGKNMMGFALIDGKKWVEAEASFRDAIRIWKETLGVENSNVASALVNLARVLQSDGRPVEALPPSVEALQIIEKVATPDDPRPWVFLGRQGSILADLGRWEEANAALEKSFRGLESIHAPAGRQQVVLEALVRCNNNWGKAVPTGSGIAAAMQWQQKLDALKAAAIRSP